MSRFPSIFCSFLSLSSFCQEIITNQRLSSLSGEIGTQDKTNHQLKQTTMSDKKTLLIVGATGQQGGAVLQALASNPITRDQFVLRALTRDPSSAKAQKLLTTYPEAKIELVKGDLNSTESLSENLKDVYGAYLVVNFWDKGVGAEGEIRLSKQFLDIAKSSNVQHIVYSSVGSANKSTGVPHFDSKFVVEEYLKTLNFPNWHILRPVAFMENHFTFHPVKRGVVNGLVQPDTKLQYIATEDIGVFASLAFQNPSSIPKELDLAGDEIDGNSIAQVFNKVLGIPETRPLKYAPIPVPGFILRFVMYDLWKMMDFFENQKYEADIPRLRQLYPGLQNFEMWVTKQKALGKFDEAIELNKAENAGWCTFL